MSSCALALAAGCSSPSPSPPPPPDPRPLRAQSAADLTAVGLGVAIDASDELGAPRLVRAVAPRSALAGSAPDAAARDHVAALAPLWIDHRRAPDLESRGVQRLRGGAALVRLDQRVGGVAIHHGELRVLVHGDGSLAAISGTLRASPGRASFQSTPTAALHRALDALYGAARARPAITEGADRAGYRELAVAGDPEVQVQRARARRELLPDGDRLIAIWSVELFAARPDADGAVAQAARRYLIGDADGRVIRDIDLIASDAFSYRAFADPGGDHDPLDGALASFNPHPTGAPDGTLPPPASASLVAIEAFNAPHDPWLAATATTTSGNNVEAFADIALPLGFSPGDVRPELSAAHTFDQSYDFAAEPLATAAQSSAAAINLFFVTNWLHDWYYDSGFTEATGNAQLDNLGRGGIPGDPLVARAQANAIGGSRDNANIGTPDDGLSPVMNMFLWTGTPSTTLTTPAGTPGSAGFTAGPRAFDVTGGVVLVEDRIGGTHRACGRVTAAAAGKIALFESDGTCATSIAISNASRAGAIGVIAMIATPGAAAHGLPGSALNLPGLVIGFDDGVALEAALPVTATIHRTTSLEHDGDFDNAIVAHEWGHYLHHRLAACEAAQCGAMSEGWGDFTSLHMMLRETDARAGTFGVGLYALAAGGIAASGFADPGYFGIRRFPYSTDRAKNALSFRHIGDGAALPGVPTNPGPAGGANSEVHNAGEIWAAMLWEVYNALIDQHGFAEARRRMSDYVVAGLLLTPPDATFTEGRDALIAAAGALDSDDELLMAAAFAGRGAGSCAASPERGSLDFAGVVESGTIAARLATSAISLTDDGASCDHDGYLDPGESGLLRVTVANTGILTAEGVVVSATTTTPGVILGKPIALGDLVARSSVDLAIPVVLAA
ncbi:MAG TPA: M36 family metallopeptidase, partial [Kofleriaceae bacterium]|nr:M36 family metallopeptidase [Kofleriaceae bacterium]